MRLRVNAFCVSLLLLWAVSSAEQFVFFDEESQIADGYGMTPALNQLGPPGYDWLSPTAYHPDAHMYVRYELLTNPEAKISWAQICMWQDSYALEQCVFIEKSIEVRDPGVYYKDYGAFSEWWTKVSLDWTREFQCVKVVHRTVPGNGFVGNIPQTFEVAAVVVAPGDKLACPQGWECPAEWGADATSAGRGMAIERRSEVPTVRVRNGAVEIRAEQRDCGVAARGARILDMRGSTVKSLCPARDPLGWRFVWDGTGAGGRRVAPGVYVVRWARTGAIAANAIVFAP